MTQTKVREMQPPATVTSLMSELSGLDGQLHGGQTPSLKQCPPHDLYATMKGSEKSPQICGTNLTTTKQFLAFELLLGDLSKVS